MNNRILPVNETIKKCHLKVTTQRTKVLTFLRDANVPLSAENIYFKLRDKGIAINLSTVYRTLESFMANNIIASINVDGKKEVLYEYVSDHHHHYLICLNCNKIVSLDHCPLESYEKDLERDYGYTLTSHRLVLYGYCHDCKSK